MFEGDGKSGHSLLAWAFCQSNAIYLWSGLLINDFFLYALLLAYVLASPKQPKRAEETFLRVIRAGHVEVNQHLMTVLWRAVGRQRAKTILALAQCNANSSVHGERISI